MICFGHAGQNSVIFSYVGFDASNVLQQIINTLLNLKWQRALLLRNHVTQGIRTLWRDDAEFRYQSSQAIIRCCFLFDKSLTSAVQALHRLLAFILNWYKSHVWATNRFTDSLCISCIIFP
nr:Uncharacterised protein [Enterobacter mori]